MNYKTKIDYRLYSYKKNFFYNTIHLYLLHKNKKIKLNISNLKYIQDAYKIIM